MPYMKKWLKTDDIKTALGKFKNKALFYRTIEIEPSNYQGEKNSSTKKMSSKLLYFFVINYKQLNWLSTIWYSMYNGIQCNVGLYAASLKSFRYIA